VFVRRVETTKLTTRAGPFVEKGAKQVTPDEELPMDGGLCRQGATFERSLALLYAQVLLPLGFEIEAWSRVPYISEGDSAQNLYFLDDALIVLKTSSSAQAEDIVEPSVQSVEKKRGLFL